MNDVQILPEPKSAKFSQQTLILKRRLTEKALLSLEKTIRDFPNRAERAFAAVGLKVRFFEVDKFADQEYKIEIGAGGVIVCGGRREGLFYGYQTLVQILSQCDREVPCCVIEDAPDLPLRAFYLDLRVHKFKPAFIKHLFRELARLKYNAVVIHYEDTYPFKKEQFITGPVRFTGEQVNELDKAAGDVGLELIPYQPALGRLHYILELAPYAHLAREVTGDAATACAHTSLRELDTTNPRASALITALLDDLAAAHKSPYVFVGARHEDLTPGDADADTEGLVHYLMPILAHVAKKGKRPMVWSDIIDRCPDCVSQLPKETLVVVRHADTQSALSKRMKFYRDAGLRTVAAASCLDSPDNEFARDISRSVENLHEAAKVAKRSAATGLLLVSRASSDAAPVRYRNGTPVGMMHGLRRMHLETTWYAISAAAEFAWNAGAADEERFAAKWPRCWFGADDKKLCQVQQLQAKDIFQGATHPEILRDRKRLIKLVSELKPVRHRAQLAFLEFYARLAIHAVHARQIFSHSPKKQEIALLRGEIARLKERHRNVMKSSLYSREIAEEQEYLFGHAEMLLVRLAGRK